MIANNLFYMVFMLVLYFVLFVFIPSVLLHPYVKEYSLGYRILFYQISSLTYVTVASYALCFTGLFNSFFNWMLYVIIPILTRGLISRKQLKELLVKKVELYKLHLVLGESIHARFRRIRKNIKSVISKFWNLYIVSNIIQIISIVFFIIVIIVVYGYFHIHYYTYACSDETTHTYYVNSILSGNPFPSGLYPHSMHFIVAVFCSMFGLIGLRAWVSFGIVSVTVIITSMYLLLRLLVPSNFAAATSIIIFLLSNVFRASMYSRFLEVMPMEMAVYAYFVMIYGLLVWAKGNDKQSLAMFVMGLVGTASLHIFVTLFSIFTILSFFIVYHNRMAANKVLYKFFLSGIVSVVLILSPYIIGIGIGYSLEQSFTWGMSVISDDYTWDSGFESTEDSVAVGTYNAFSGEIQDAELTSPSLILANADSLYDYLLFVESLFNKSLTEKGYGWIVVFISVLFSATIGILGCSLSKKNKNKHEYYLTVLFLTLSWILSFVLLYTGYYLDFLSLMSPDRSSEFIAFLTVPLFAFVLQIFYNIVAIAKIKMDYVDIPVTFASLCAVVILCYLGFLKNPGELVYTFTMEDSDLAMEEELINSDDDFMWTVISTTNARLGVINNGYHYEITDLLIHNGSEDVFNIPTPDIYIVVENRVPEVAQNMLVDGSNFVPLSVPVSAEYASVSLNDVFDGKTTGINSTIYLTDNSRRVIMSHLYYWMEKIKEIYPCEVSIYSQDEVCTIYKITQDPYFLLDLSVDYSDLVTADLNK